MSKDQVRNDFIGLDLKLMFEKIQFDRSVHGKSSRICKQGRKAIRPYEDFLSAIFFFFEGLDYNSIPATYNIDSDATAYSA